MIDGWLKIILMTGCVLLAAGIILSMIRAVWKMTGPNAMNSACR